MKKLTWTPLLVLLAAMPASADTAEDLDQWFRDGYAALYVENAWDHADDFAQYLAEEIVVRSDDGVETTDVNGFVVDLLDGWRNEGWLGTDVADLETKLLNSTTAVFDIKWLDRNDDGSTELSCGWYLADKVGDKWLLSQYISMKCTD
ncbi:MAG: hypothetical protein GWP62_13190 [Gammaproteobacteria bacterium]|nr:hypothetical protein [Gammaproteobacteria bacterium]